MKNIRRYDISLIRRPASYRGPRSSEDWTDTIDELIRDLVELSNQWNVGIIPLITTLPDGSDDSLVDAFANGIDGRTVYVDSSLTSSSSITTYWHATRERPKVIKEALEDIYTYIDTQITSVQTDVAAASGPLTSEQKARIGSNIFDSAATSSATSLDGKSETNRLNVIQLAKDLYGSAYASLDGDGNENLTNNSVRAMVDALLEAHGGNWDTDITLVHSGITLTQAWVTQSASYNDSYAGVPTNLQDDLNQIRTQIKTYGGGAAWTTAMPELYTGGADTLYELLNSTAGTAAQSATNPWGYHYDDIDGLATVLDALRDFVGQDDHTDSTPGYGIPTYVDNGDTLESGIRKLDRALYSISGIFDDYAAFTGLIDTPNNYISQSGQVLRVGNLTGATVDSGIVFDDFTFINLEDTPDGYTGNSGQITRVNYDEDALEFTDPSFSGLVDTPYHYVGHSGQIVHINGTEDELDFASAHIREDDVLETAYDIEIIDSGMGLVMVDSGTNRWRLHADINGVPYTLPADGAPADDLSYLFNGQDMAGDYKSELLPIEHISRVGFQITDDGGSTTRAGSIYFRLTNSSAVSGVAMAVPVVPVVAGVNINEYVEISDLASRYIEVLYDSSTSGPGETLTITAWRKYPN